jgi:hypothetical protein
MSADLGVVGGVIVLFGVTIVPVIVGARIVHAQNISIGSAFFAIIALSAVSAAIGHFISNPILAFVVSVLASAILLAGILGTTLLRGLAVSVIIVAIQFAVILGIIGVQGGAS